MYVTKYECETIQHKFMYLYMTLITVFYVYSKNLAFQDVAKQLLHSR